MKRSTLIVIAIIFVSIIIGGLLGFYFYINSKAAKEATLGTRVPTGSFGTPGLDTSVTLPGNASTTDQDQKPLIEATEKESPIPTLRKIFGEPVSGAAFFKKEIYATTSPSTETILVANGTSTITTTRTITPPKGKLIGVVETLVFIERAKGHIYGTATSTIVNSKISNTTIPKIYEAFFINRESVLLRGLNEISDIITTKLGTQTKISATSTEATLVQKNLPDDLQQTILSPSKNKVFFLQKKSPLGIISNTDGSNATAIFDSPFREWIASWPNEKTITLTTKATSFTNGYMYSIDTTTKNFTKVMGGKRGLTTLMSPDGTKVLYSEALSGSSYLSVFDTQTKSSRQLFLRTLAEKCVWSNTNKDVFYCAVPQDIALGDYPDVWYQGLIFFRDQIWRSNISTGETRLIATLDDLGTDAIDVTNPILNSDETFLVFNNKIDLSLWGLNLPPQVKQVATTTTQAR